MSTARLLSRYETCARAGYWARSWERQKLDGTEILQAALSVGLTETERVDIGELAGETVLEIAADRGLLTSVNQVYDAAIHHAALADILTQVVRRPGNPAWRPAEPILGSWTPSCYIDPSGGHLRRIVLVSQWNDERHASEARSWESLGEISHFKLPMQQVVLVLGQHRDGKRHGPFSKGYLHPQGSELRFRRKGKRSTSTFNANWSQIWREDVGGHIGVERWLQAMLEDDMLRDVSFTVELPVPSERDMQAVRDMAERKLEALSKISELPDANLSTCFWPVPCVFQPECHAGRAPSLHRFVSATTKG
jgi:hypothetical protein